MTDPAKSTTPNRVRIRERVELDRDEGRQQRQVSRWVLRGLLALAIVVAALGGGGASWNVVFAVWALLALAVPFAFVAVPSKPPRVFFGLTWLAVGGLVALQVLPLPRLLVQVLQPRALELSDLGRSALGLAPLGFVPLAIAPGDAAWEGAVYLMGAALTLLGSIALSGHDGRRAIHWVANVIMGTALASGLAWVCAFTSPVTDFVPSSLSARLASLCFVNANSEAGLLVAGTALALGRMRLSLNPRWQTAFGLIALTLSLVTLEVGSRGGILTLGMVLAMTTFMRQVYRPGQRVDIRDLRRAALVRTGVLVAAVALAAATVALPAIEAEFAPRADSHKGTRMLAMLGVHDAQVGAKSLLADTWRAGAGPGGLPVLAGLDPVWGAQRVDFAENLVLDWTLMFGVLFGLAALGAVVYSLLDLVRRRRDVPQAPAFIIGITAVLTANLVDFSLQLAGGLLPFLAMTVACERALGPRGGREGLEDKRLPTFRRVMVAAVLAIAVSGGLLARSLNAMSRHVDAVLQDTDTAGMPALIAERFPNDHHAYYLYGRKLAEQGKLRDAAKAFDRAVALRPDSAHARLFHFATHLELGDTAVATADLRWLLAQEEVIVRRAMTLCSQSRSAEQVLIDVIPAGKDQSLRVADMLADKHPELVERVALALRRKFPKRVFGIEYARAQLYVASGQLEPAKRIAASLIAQPETRDLGYRLEAALLRRANRHYEAYHLLRDVCDRSNDNPVPCFDAVEAIVAANRPEEAKRYLRQRAPFMQSYTSHAATYWYARGRVDVQLERQEDALEAFRRAHGFAPNSLEIELALAETCANLGLRDEARALVDEALVRAPGNPVAKRLSVLLDRDVFQAIGNTRSADPTPTELQP